MLTLQQLKDMEPGTVFAKGFAKNELGGLYMTGNYKGRELLWVAKRGAIHDWAIYTNWSDLYSIGDVLAHGDKVTDKQNIQKLVPCDPEALAMYRF